MASDVRLVSSRLVSDPKGGNVCGTAEEGKIVVKEELEDEAPLVEVQMKPNDVQIKTENDDAPFLAGNLLPVTIKEEEGEVVTTILNPTATAKPNLYKCHLCPAAFTHYQITREHIRGHSVGYRSCVCSHCQQAFYSVSELSQHQLEHGNCHQAPSTSEAEEPLTTYQMAIKEEVETTPKTSNTPPTSTTTGKPGRFPCSICQASFPDSQTTLEHIRGHSYGFRSHPCLVCDQSFCTTSELSKHQDEQHQRSNLEPKPTVPNFTLPPAGPDHRYSCTLCLRTFKHPSILYRHQRSHQQLDVVSGMKTSSKTPTFQLNLHTAPSPISTPECALNLPKDASPKPPSPIPPSSSGYTCEFCRKSYRTRYNFTVHLRQHTGERPHLCSLCPASFTNRGHLKRHEKESHGKAEPSSFTCSSCQRTYANWRKLWRHTRQKHPPPGTEPSIRPNGGPKRHLCEVCGKAFAAPVHLANHRRAVHTGERPYGCTDCDYRATSQGALAKHRKQVHTRVRGKPKMVRSKGSKRGQSPGVIESEQL